MQQLISAYQVLEQHLSIVLEHQLNEDSFITEVSQILAKLNWQESSREQGADWAALAFRLEQNLWWWRCDFSANTVWIETAREEDFDQDLASILTGLKHLFEHIQELEK